MHIQNRDEVDHFLANYVPQEGEQLMIYLADRSVDWLDELMTDMNRRGIRFFGGIFPGLLYNGNYLRSGLLIQTVKPVFQTLVHPFLLRLPKDLPPLDGCTAVVLMDGLSTRFRDLADTMEGKLGRGVTYIGGGAGFYDMKHRPCLFDNRGVYKDAALLCILAGKTRIMVSHGWEKMDGPFLITQSEQNVLKKLDGYPALDIYGDTIESHRNLILSKEDFFSVAKEHPFGLLQEDGSLVVRDPITCTAEREIICVADLPNETYVFILKGNKRTLLASSLAIADECARHRDERFTPVLFNCISRAMFLEEDFQTEIRNIQNQLDRPLIGALSIGEMTSNADSGILIHNKSTVFGFYTA